MRYVVKFLKVLPILFFCYILLCIAVRILFVP